MELYHDEHPYRHGIFFFDLQRQPEFVEGTGKLDMYLSDGQKFFGPRGVQICYVAAGILPELKRHPDVWESYYRRNHASEPLVRIVDRPPATDGRRDRDYDQSVSVKTPQAEVTLLADPKHVHLLIESTRPNVEIRIRPEGPVVGDVREGRVTAHADGTVAAVNDKAEKLLCAKAFHAGSRWTAELRIPQTYVKGQKPWINAVDHGRYRLSIDGGPSRTVYMLSEPQRIVTRLEQMVLGTIETWHQVWRETGVLPSSYRSPKARVPRWEVSDAGSYAALIQTIALWLMYEEGTSDWELIRAQTPEQPIPSRPLPAGVIEAQGR